MNGLFPYANPYALNGFNPLQPAQPVQAPQQVVKVNGEGGARAYQMGANSSALLLDESGLMIWLCTTDGAGYKSVSAYDITPHQAAPAPDFSGLETRITKLEEIVNGNSRNASATRKSKSDDGTD